MNYHLICVTPFGNYVKGQTVTDEAEVARLRATRNHHFVKIFAPKVLAPEELAVATHE